MAPAGNVQVPQDLQAVPEAVLEVGNSRLDIRNLRSIVTQPSQQPDFSMCGCGNIIHPDSATGVHSMLWDMRISAVGPLHKLEQKFTDTTGT